MGRDGETCTLARRTTEAMRRVASLDQASSGVGRQRRSSEGSYTRSGRWH
jgi:hypothetical protein